MAAPASLVNLLAPGAKTRGLDLNALLAIASHEGAGGGIGDNGHAFGPFQLNDAGGVLTGKLAGLSPAQKNAWAWSPAGIKFAENGIARVASGLHGADAVRAIASRFERPANVQAEISDALAHYGKTGATLAPTSSAPGPPAPSPGGQSSGFASLLPGLIGSTNALLGMDSSPTLGNLLQAAWDGPPKPPKPPTGGGKRPPGNGALGAPTGPIGPGLSGGAFKFEGDTKGEQQGFLNGLASAARAVGATAIRINSGYRSPAHNAAVGGVQGSLHTQGRALDGEALINGRWVPLGVALKPVAAKYGLRSGAVPGFFHGKPDPVHVDAGYA